MKSFRDKFLRRSHICEASHGYKVGIIEMCVM